MDESRSQAGAPGDTHNIVVGGTIGYLVQARDIGQINIHPVLRDAAPLDRALARLAIRVAAQWQAEIAVMGVDEQVPMAVRWRATGLSAGGGVGELVAAFGQLAHRRMLILGGAGAGKTTLAMLIVLGLLRARAERDPVPILLPVSSWPDNEHFHSWLARMLKRGYPWLGRQTARDLVAARRVLPVLDGLDEVPASRRTGILSKLNATLTAGDAVIITCRSAEYSAAASAGYDLRFAATLQAEPVSAQAAGDYLIAAAPAGQLPRWRLVMAYVAEHPAAPLTRALANPLMVWLVRASYARPKADPAALIGADWPQDGVALRGDLLDRLVPALFDTGPPSPDRPVKRWRPDQAEAWLRFLARHLTRNHTDDLAWWRLHRAVPGAVRAVFFAFLVWLYFWGLPPLIESQAVRLSRTGTEAFLAPLNAAAGLVFGVIFGLILQVFAGIAFGSDLATSVPSSVGGLPGLRRAGRGLALGFPPRRAALLAAVVSVAGLAGVAGAAPAARVPVIVSALAIVGLAALRMALAAPGDADQAATPGTMLRNARVSEGLLTGVLPPVIGGLLGLAFSAAGTESGVVTGVVAWLAATAVMVVTGAWFRFNLVRAYLATARQVPWPLMRFLRDAHRLGVLRQTGGVYQFRHRSLRDRLAGLPLPEEDDEPAVIAGAAVAAAAASGANSVTAGTGSGGASAAADADAVATGAAPEPDTGLAGGYRVPLRQMKLPRKGVVSAYAMCWGFALLWVVIITVQRGWGEQGAWQTIGFFLVVPVFAQVLWRLVFLIRRCHYRGRTPELIITADLISVTVPGPVEVHWHDVIEVTVRRTMAANGMETRTYSVQVLPDADASQFPRTRRQPGGWIVLFSVGTSPDIPREIGDALARFGGSRWRPPPGVLAKGDRS